MTDKLILTNLATCVSYPPLTIEDAAEVLCIGADILTQWCATHPNGGRINGYIIVPDVEIDEAEEKALRARMASTWGKKWMREWDKACEPFRAIQRQRDGLTGVTLDGMDEILDVVGWNS